MATMLVTGGSGFIGRNLCQLALSEGWQVIVLTRDAEAAAKRLPPSIKLIERLADLEADIAIQAAACIAMSASKSASRSMSLIDGGSLLAAASASRVNTITCQPSLNASWHRFRPIKPLPPVTNIVAIF